MNILFFVPYVPNLIRVRPYNLIRSLVERGHRVTLATLWTSEAERQTLDAIRESCDQVIGIRLPTWRSLLNVLGTLPSGAPLQAAYSWDRALAGKIIGLAACGNGKPAYDAVHVEHLRGVRYALHLQAELARQESRVPVVWDSVDSISLLFRQAVVRSRSPLSRAITRFELGRTERYEGWLAHQFRRVLVTSPADREALLALCPESAPRPAIEVLRNGVDLEYFRPDESVAREPATVVVSGKMSYHANVAMALNLVQEIMPRVWAQQPEVQVWVVGKDPPKQVLALGEDPRVTVTGTVSDLRPYLRRATVAVSPIAYGAGIQNKVLEALACGTSVVATPQAVSALSLEAGKDLLVAPDPAEFAGSVLRLLAEPDLRRQVGQAGRRYVETHHNWAAAAAQLEGVYHQVRSEPQPEPGKFGS